MDKSDLYEEAQSCEKTTGLVPIKRPYEGVPRDWKESGVPPSNEVIPYQVRTIDHREEQLADERKSVFEQIDQGMSAGRGMELLGLKKSHFYKLLDDHRNGKDIIRNHRGTPRGGSRTTSGQVAALSKAFENHYGGPKASISELLKWSNRYCERAGEKPISRHTARRYLYAIPEKDRDRKILTVEQFNQKYGYKPNKLIIDCLLRRVSMDHTRVDILLVDEFNRDVIIGRPWITLIICDKSRVILGFYLSMEAPSINTVAAALAFAIMNKESSLLSFFTHPGEFPFFGIPFVIFTDNAAEFTSEAFIQQCKEWGMEWEHRPIGKKWYGGIIERVIGSFMTTGVHFLPGSTGSNVVERQSFESELNAQFDFKQCAEWIVKEITVYHGKIHNSLRCTPRQAFTHYKSEGKYDSSRIISKKDEARFLIDFCPTSFKHKVHSYGINFAGRRYESDALKDYVGEELDVKYLQYDLSYIWVNSVYIGAIRNDIEGVTKELELPPRPIQYSGYALGYRPNERPAKVKSRLPQSAVLHHETYSAAGEEGVLAEYDERLSAFYQRDGRGRGGDLSGHPLPMDVLHDSFSYPAGLVQQARKNIKLDRFNNQ